MNHQDKHGSSPKGHVLVKSSARSQEVDNNIECGAGGRAFCKQLYSTTHYLVYLDGSEGGPRISASILLEIYSNMYYDALIANMSQVGILGDTSVTYGRHTLKAALPCLGASYIYYTYILSKLDKMRLSHCGLSVGAAWLVRAVPLCRCSLLLQPLYNSKNELFLFGLNVQSHYIPIHTNVISYSNE